MQIHLARRFIRAGQQRPDHRAIPAGGKRLGKVTRIFDAAIGNNRHALRMAYLSRIHDRSQLRDTDAGHHAGGADRTRPDTDLDRISARRNEIQGSLRGSDIATDY